MDQVELLKSKTERIEEQKQKIQDELDSCEEKLHAEKRYKEEANKGKKSAA